MRSRDDEERFTNAHQQVAALATAALQMRDFDFARRELDLCDSVGFVTDPTTYRDRMEDREALKLLLDAAMAFQMAALRFSETQARLISQRLSRPPRTA